MKEKHYFPHNVARSKVNYSLRELDCHKCSRILEIGCGSGETTKFITKLSTKIIGIDVLPESLREYCNQGYAGVRADAYHLPFKDNTFDFVMFSMVLHHITNGIPQCLQEARRVVTPKGYVLCLEPNAINLSGILVNIFNAIKPGITGLDPSERAILPQRLVSMYKMANLKNVNCISASYTWNRLPLFLSKMIARYEDSFRCKSPFNLFGWFIIVSGQRE